MEADPHDGHISFEHLFSINVPDILEHIFFSLDYCSYKCCLEVSNRWRELLTSERYIERGKSVFREDILEDEIFNLHYSVEHNDIDETKRLLASGMVDVNFYSPHYLRSPTLLHKAAMYGHREVALLLIQHGADPKLADNHDGLTPLHYAAKCGHSEVAQSLNECGAELNCIQK